MVENLPEWLAGLLSADMQATLAYLTNGKHLAWYASLRFTIIAAVFGAVFSVIFGLLGAALQQSGFFLFRWIGTIYTNMLRGIPDVLFFLFLPLAFEQSVEYFMARSRCTSEQLANITQWPPCQEAQWFLSTNEYLLLACVTLGIVYGAFTANVINGAMQAVPRGQLEAAQAYGFSKRQVFWNIKVRQMWVYALPGLSNVWILLLKATSLLSLLQITDIVYWASSLGAANYLPRVGLVHPDWRWKYFLVLFLLYILLAYLSEKFFDWVMARTSKGMIEAS